MQIKASLYGKHTSGLACLACNDGMATWRSNNLKTHYSTRHQGVEYPYGRGGILLSNQKGIPCDKCKIILSNKKSLNQHMKKLHPVGIKEMPPPSSKLVKQQVQQGKCPDLHQDDVRDAIPDEILILFDEKKALDNCSNIGQEDFSMMSTNIDTEEKDYETCDAQSITPIFRSDISMFDHGIEFSKLNEDEALDIPSCINYKSSLITAIPDISKDREGWYRVTSKLLPPHLSGTREVKGRTFSYVRKNGAIMFPDPVFETDSIQEAKIVPQKNKQRMRNFKRNQGMIKIQKNEMIFYEHIKPLHPNSDILYTENSERRQSLNFSKSQGSEEPLTFARLKITLAEAKKSLSFADFVKLVSGKSDEELEAQKIDKTSFTSKIKSMTEKERTAYYEQYREKAIQKQDVEKVTNAYQSVIEVHTLVRQSFGRKLQKASDFAENDRMEVKEQFKNKRITKIEMKEKLKKINNAQIKLDINKLSEYPEVQSQEVLPKEDIEQKENNFDKTVQTDDTKLLWGSNKDWLDQNIGNITAREFTYMFNLTQADTPYLTTTKSKKTKQIFALCNIPFKLKSCQKCSKDKKPCNQCDECLIRLFIKQVDQLLGSFPNIRKLKWPIQQQKVAAYLQRGIKQQIYDFKRNSLRNMLLRILYEIMPSCEAMRKILPKINIEIDLGDDSSEVIKLWMRIRRMSERGRRILKKSYYSLPNPNKFKVEMATYIDIMTRFSYCSEMKRRNDHRKNDQIYFNPKRKEQQHLLWAQDNETWAKEKMKYIICDNLKSTMEKNKFWYNMQVLHAVINIYWKDIDLEKTLKKKYNYFLDPKRTEEFKDTKHMIDRILGPELRSKMSRTAWISSRLNFQTVFTPEDSTMIDQCLQKIKNKHSSIFESFYQNIPQGVLGNYTAHIVRSNIPQIPKYVQAPLFKIEKVDLLFKIPTTKVSQSSNESPLKLPQISKIKTRQWSERNEQQLDVSASVLPNHGNDFYKQINPIQAFESSCLTQTVHDKEVIYLKRVFETLISNFSVSKVAPIIEFAVGSARNYPILKYHFPKSKIYINDYSKSMIEAAQLQHKIDDSQVILQDMESFKSDISFGLFLGWWCLSYIVDDKQLEKFLNSCKKASISGKSYMIFTETILTDDDDPADTDYFSVEQKVRSNQQYISLFKKLGFVLKETINKASYNFKYVGKSLNMPTQCIYILEFFNKKEKMNSKLPESWLKKSTNKSSNIIEILDSNPLPGNQLSLYNNYLIEYWDKLKDVSSIDEKYDRDLRAKKALLYRLKNGDRKSKNVQQDELDMLYAFLNQADDQVIKKHLKGDYDLQLSQKINQNLESLPDNQMQTHILWCLFRRNDITRKQFDEMAKRNKRRSQLKESEDDLTTLGLAYKEQHISHTMNLFSRLELKESLRALEHLQII